jgi:hypothetical protein
MKTGATPVRNRRDIQKPSSNRLTWHGSSQFRLNPTNSGLKNLKSASKVNRRTGALMQISERGSVSRSNARFSGAERDSQAFRASTVAGRRPALLQICACPPNLKFPSPEACRAEVRRRRISVLKSLKLKITKRTHFLSCVERTTPLRQLFPIRVYPCSSVVKKSARKSLSRNRCQPLPTLATGGPLLVTCHLSHVTFPQRSSLPLNLRRAQSCQIVEGWDGGTQLRRQSAFICVYLRFKVFEKKLPNEPICHFQIRP